jgi:D-beta-D-heptose 7-phosphate kinase/D-beta-D-heptose 1-phosphate adenosyltransferase
VTSAAELPPLGADRARALVAAFGRASVLVIGDVMLDRFLVGRVDRISPEAPVPIVAFDHEENRVGGAANVAHNVAALGGRVDVVGLTGADEAGERLAGELRDRDVSSAGLVVDRTRRTTLKTRVVTTRNQQVARIDYETDGEASGDAEQAVIERAVALAEDAGVIVVSDYLKGCVTPALMTALAACARQRQLPLLVDPKIPHIHYYAGATLITPNHHEAETAAHMRIRTQGDARAAARAVRERAQSAGVLITRGEHGMWLLDAEYEGHLSATAREVADVTGAGDTVLATLALALAAGASSAEAARLANHAAGIVVGKFGPATVSPEELLEAVADRASRYEF